MTDGALARRIAELEAELAELRRRDDRIQLAIGGASDGLWFWDLTTGSSWWSTRMWQLLGFEPGELAATYDTWVSLLHPEDRELALGAVRLHLERREPYETEYRLHTKREGFRWFRARGVAEWDPSGRPLRMAGSFKDIHERRLFEWALRHEREFTGYLIDSSLNGILAFDMDFHYTVWNPAMERMSGVSRADALGRYAFDLFPFLVETGEDEGFRAATSGRTLVTRDRPYVVPETGKQGYFEGLYAPLRNDSGEIVGGLGFIRDITEHKREEQQRRELEQQLRQSQKMEAIGQLAGGIAHDFNNLMTAVLGNAELLIARSGTTPSALGDDDRARLERIRDASLRAGALTRQLLSFSRKQPLQPETLDTARVLRELETLLAPLIREDIRFVVEIEEPVPPVHADAVQIEQILLNLVLNARDAMPSGGTLTVRCAADDERDGELSRPCVALTVTDTGLGIDADVLPRIFEPFFTTKPAGEGTGLGLAMVDAMVQQVGGRISVESRPGDGTRFRVSLPAVLDAANRDAPEAAREIAPRRGSTIVFCEDDGAVRDVSSSILRDAGHTVLEATTAEEALELLAAHDGGAELLVTDVVLSSMNGRELAERAGLPTLFISGYADGAVRTDWPGSPPSAFLQKPYAADALLARVRELLG